MSNELNGKSFVLQIEDPASPGTYATVGGLKTKSLSWNGDPVEITNHGSQGWREILSGAGIDSMDISGEGVTQRVDTLKWILETKKAKGFLNVRLEALLGDVNFLRVDMTAFIASFEITGENDKEVPYSLSLQSSGEPTIEIY